MFSKFLCYLINLPCLNSRNNHFWFCWLGSRKHSVVFSKLTSHGSFLTLFRMGLFEAAHGWVQDQKDLPFQNFVIHIWQIYTLPKEDPKNIWITWHTPWILLTSALFHWKLANYVISVNKDIDCILVHNFYF